VSRGHSKVLAANILFEDPFMWPFAIATFVLAVLAIYLGSVR
jgi:predicted membrane protein